METDYESRYNISFELEKICGEWSIYARHIERPKPQRSVHDLNLTISQS